jgi:hypothetical protein
MPHAFTTGLIDLCFANGNRAQALALAEHQTSLQALDAMDLTRPRPTLVIIGGASLMSPESLERLQTVFDQVLAPLAEGFNLTVLDGGTDAGVIHMMGQARRRLGGRFPLVGVVPQGKARLPSDRPTDSDRRHDLEPNHTHFFLIPGEHWGSESPWLAEFATRIAIGQPSLTLLVNGGKVALTDLSENLATDRPALVLSGSGRLADTVASALVEAPPQVDPPILELVQHYQPSGKLGLIDMAMPTAQMRDRLHDYFAPAP